MAVPYATVAEYEAHVGSIVDQGDVGDVERDLRRASVKLDRHITASFEVDDVTGLPATVRVAEACRDAACEQAAYLQATRKARNGNYASVSIGKLTYQFRGPGDVDAGRLTSSAADILATEGLL